MGSNRAVRRRLIVLAVLGTIFAGLLAYRRRAIAQRAEEFHQRYG